jgi:hypothetical protein
MNRPCGKEQLGHDRCGWLGNHGESEFNVVVQINISSNYMQNSIDEKKSMFSCSVN